MALGGTIRHKAALLALGLCLAKPAAASNPPLLWSGAEQVAIFCLLHTDGTGDAPALESRLCERVASLASQGAPVKVVRAAPGDPALIRTDTIALLVHASLERTAQGPVFSFTIRPRRPGGDDEILFGTAPRSVAVPSGQVPAALDEALLAALSEILPWLRREDKPRPL